MRPHFLDACRLAVLPTTRESCSFVMRWYGVSVTTGRGESGEDALEAPRSVDERIVFRPCDSP